MIDSRGRSGTRQISNLNSGTTWSQQATSRPRTPARRGSAKGSPKAIKSGLFHVAERRRQYAGGGCDRRRQRRDRDQRRPGRYMANQSGAAYVFTRRCTTWSQQAYVKSSMTRPNVLFGYSIAVSANGDHWWSRSSTPIVARARSTCSDAPAAPGRTRPGSSPPIWRTATRSGIRSPSAATATPSRPVPPTRTA